MAAPMSDVPDTYQVVISGSLTNRAFQQWLRDMGLQLFPIPNGERDGQLVVDVPEDLRTYGITVRTP